MPFGAIANAFGTAAQIDGQRSKDTFEYFAGKEASATQYRRQKKLMDKQMANELALARDMPSAITAGLRDAGVNPILAAAQGFKGGSAASGQAALPNTPSGSASISSGDIGSALTAKRQLDQQEPVQTETANLLREQQITERKKQEQIAAETESEKNRPDNIRASTQLSESQKVNRDIKNMLDRIPAEFYNEYPELYFFRDGEIGAGSVQAGKSFLETAKKWLEQRSAKKAAQESASAAAVKAAAQRNTVPRKGHQVPDKWSVRKILKRIFGE